MSATTTTPPTPWPTVKLGDVCEVVSVRGHQIKQTEIKPTGRYPVVSQSERKIEGYSDEPIAIKDVPLILFGDHTCCVKFIDFPFIVGADGTKLLRPNMMELNYFRYCLENARESLCDGKYRRHFSDLIEMEIPLPPLEVQREIVAKVEAGLKKADALVAHFKRLTTLADETFKAELDETFTTLNAPTVKLGDVCEVARGGSPRPIKSYITQAVDGLNWIKIGDVSPNGKYIEKTAEKIKPSGLHKTRRVSIGEFLLSNSMSFGRPYILKIDGCIHDGWLVLRGFQDVLEENFFYHLLRTEYVQSQFETSASGSTVRNLNTKSVESISIPLPSLDIQREIVGKLEAVKARCERLKAEAERGMKAAEALRKAVLAEAFEQ